MRLSVNWGTHKTSDIIQSESEGPKRGRDDNMA